MNLIKIKKNRGIAILFTVMISSIILAIALGVANIAYKELSFNTSAKDADDAFFSADTGVECALFYDKSALSDNAFIGTANMNCANNPVSISSITSSFWTFTISGLGNSGQGCAIVTVDKTPPGTIIISKGYNNGDSSCNSLNVNRVERELKVTY